MKAYGGDEQPRALLCTMLEVAVPMQVWTYLEEGRSADWLVQRAKQAGEVIAHEGDRLMFRTPGTRNKRGTAEVFTELAAGIAAAALVQEGGISIFGLHFDAELPNEAATGDG